MDTVNTEDFFAEREEVTFDRVARFGKSFERHLQDDGKEALGDQGCVYAVGSAGRGEMTKGSDLDVFLVTLGEEKRTHEILAQAAILRMMREMGLPDPSNDASFLKLHTAESLAKRLGDVKDDWSNTFTARMLLLLESRPLYGEAAYGRVLDRVIDAYWRNEEGHEDDYLPLVLLNDIVRYWRVVILNYEAKYAKKLAEEEAKEKPSPEGLARIKREKRFGSYKLRFSRCMTCYSMVARLLAETFSTDGRAHVDRTAFLGMVHSTPVNRLREVRDIAASHDPIRSAATLVDKQLNLYREYLEVRDLWGDDAPSELASEEGRSYFKKAELFGDLMFALVRTLGGHSPLYRFLVT